MQFTQWAFRFRGASVKKINSYIKRAVSYVKIWIRKVNQPVRQDLSEVIKKKKKKLRKASLFLNTPQEKVRAGKWEVLNGNGKVDPALGSTCGAAASPPDAAVAHREPRERSAGRARPRDSGTARARRLDWAPRSGPARVPAGQGGEQRDAAALGQHRARLQDRGDTGRSRRVRGSGAAGEPGRVPRPLPPAAPPAANNNSAPRPRHSISPQRRPIGWSRRLLLRHWSIPPPPLSPLAARAPARPESPPRPHPAPEPVPGASSPARPARRPSPCSRRAAPRCSPARTSGTASPSSHWSICSAGPPW